MNNYFFSIFFILFLYNYSEFDFSWRLHIVFNMQRFVGVFTYLNDTGNFVV